MVNLAYFFVNGQGSCGSKIFQTIIRFPPRLNNLQTNKQNNNNKFSFQALLHQMFMTFFN